MESERSKKLMQEVAYSQPNVPDNWHLQIEDGTPSAPPAINAASQTAHQQQPIQCVEENQSASTCTSETEERSTSSTTGGSDQEHHPHDAKHDLANDALTASSSRLVTAHEVADGKTNPLESAKEVADGETNPPMVLSMFDSTVQDSVRMTLRTVVKATIGIFLIFPIMLCLFFGVGWSPKDNYKGVRIAVVDLDGGLIGKSILAAATSPSIPFTVLVLTDVQSLDDIRRRIEVGDYNAALVAAPGASAALLAAVGSSSARYAPAAAASFILDEGRGSSMASMLRSAEEPRSAYPRAPARAAADLRIPHRAR